MDDSRPTVKIRELMTRDTTVLRPGDLLARAAQEMRLSRIRHVPIVDGGVLVGLISERDVHNLDDDDLASSIRERMREDLQTASPDTPAHEVALLMLRRAVGCVPITEEGDRLVGIVTDTDFVRAAYTLLGGTVPADEIEAEEREADSV